ncbi:MAG TPA: IclR family transcriptional regulator, partial [Gammaproteobacteria bacterium]|nr:IclR family transcriptional regulator [Gammaproteobacteria bacterium]
MAENRKPTAVDKALTLVSLIGRQNAQSAPRLADIVEMSALSKPTVHRLLTTLRRHGFVEMDQGSGTYRLGPKVLELGAQYYSGMSLQQQALPFLREASDETQATVHLGVRDGHHVVYIDKIDSTQAIRLASRVGQRAEMHCTAMGKAILAFSDGSLLDQIAASTLRAHTARTLGDADSLRASIAHVRRDGFALDDQENEPGVRCVAAPVFDSSGRVIAAISVSGTLAQVPKQSVGRIGKRLTDMCLRLSRL